MAIQGFRHSPPYYQLLERGSARLGRVKNGCAVQPRKRTLSFLELSFLSQS